MQYLMRHPGVIDELADPRLLHERFRRDELTADLDERHAGWQRSGQADESALLDTLRHAHHAEVFRTLVRDVEGLITVEQVADDLSALADALIDCTLRWAWARAEEPPPRVAPAGRDRLRQARWQGAGLRQRPRRGVPVRRWRRGRCRPGAGCVWRLRAQADHLVDAAHTSRPVVRHRHRAAAQRQLGPAGDVDRVVRALPAGPRQQHRMDLGAPGADAGALLRRLRRSGAALRRRARPGARRRARHRCAVR